MIMASVTNLKGLLSNILLQSRIFVIKRIERPEIAVKCFYVHTESFSFGISLFVAYIRSNTLFAILTSLAKRDKPRTLVSLPSNYINSYLCYLR